MAHLASAHSISVQFVEASEYNDALTTAHGTKSWVEGSKITFSSYMLGQQPFLSPTKSHGVKAKPYWRKTQAPLFHVNEKEDNVSNTNVDSLDLGGDVWR
jgi:hypothetical protein